MTVWHDTIAVFGDGDVVLRAVVVTVYAHVVLCGAAVCGAGTLLAVGQPLLGTAIRTVIACITCMAELET